MKLLVLNNRGAKLPLETREFWGQSMVVDLEQAICQYMPYRLLLNRCDLEIELYLVITDTIYSDILSKPIGVAEESSKIAPF